MIRIISDCGASRLALIPLAVLILSSCGGGSTPTDAATVTAPGTLATGSGLPPCGIEGTGSQIQSCPHGGDQFAATGTMAIARAEHTATLLRDGRVLIVGGFDGSSSPLASAELYDPATGTFTRTGDMTVARARHTAVLLNDGNVLIAGGSTGLTLSPDLDSAEIYEPSTGAFIATGKMNTDCCAGWGLSALLPDGRVFIATDVIADIYDPGSGGFTSIGPYVGPSYVLYATALLPDGRVLLVGVVDSAGTAGTTQLFDPKTNTFSRTGGRACFDCVSTATLLPNSQVLFVEAGDGVSDFAEIYDPASGTFINFGRTLDSQVFSTATRLSDGTVLIAGGQLPGSATPAGNPAVELYVPATTTFAPAASLSTGRYSHTATLLADGTVLIAGGYSAWRQPTASAEIYK
jgi:WD40 repeat protein